VCAAEPLGLPAPSVAMNLRRPSLLIASAAAILLRTAVLSVSIASRRARIRCPAEMQQTGKEGGDAGPPALDSSARLTHRAETLRTEEEADSRLRYPPTQFPNEGWQRVLPLSTA
jgi:hypothetical protein